MAITLDGIFVNGQKATFHPEDILSGDASAYTEEIGTAVEAWMEENVTGGEQVTDTTLTLPGVPADAKKTGDEISSLKEDLNAVEAEIASIEPGLSDNTKVALLNCFAHVAWTDERGQDYYDALHSALYVGRELISISAVFDAGQAVIYVDDSLNSLKQYLTVTAHYSNSTSEIVAEYALSGTLSVGTNTITVTYGTESTTVTVNGVIDFYNRRRVSYPDDADLLFLKNRQGEPATIDSVSQFVLAIMGADRSAFLTNHGKNNASARIDDGSYINNYFIPVPINATGFTITWDASETIRVYASCINLYQDTGGGHHFYRWQDSGGWFTSSGSTLTFSRSINYICLNVDNPQQGTINAFAVEFNFS